MFRYDCCGKKAINTIHINIYTYIYILSCVSYKYADIYCIYNLYVYTHANIDTYIIRFVNVSPLSTLLSQLKDNSQKVTAEFPRQGRFYSVMSEEHIINAQIFTQYNILSHFALYTYIYFFLSHFFFYVLRS